MLARAESYWRIPRDRRHRWRTLEAWRHALMHELEVAGAKKLGGIDLTKPYDLVTFDLRERAALTGEFALDWVLKFLQRDGEQAVGCTLLLDADTGDVRYRVDKSTGTRPRKRGLLKRTAAAPVPPPPERRLRVFAFDPSLGLQLESAGINEVQLAVPWERDHKGKDILQPGPVGEYVEVVDHDPASGASTSRSTSTIRRIVAQDGLPPSESNPQFHQQMVYAVAMRTIRNFEHALGRLALWAPHRAQEQRRRGQRNTSSACASTRTPCARRTPTTARRRRRCCSATSRAAVDGRGETARRDRLHLPSPRHRRARDDARAARRHAPPLQRAEQPRRARLPRGVRRHRRALPALLASGDVLRHQIAETRGDLASQNLLGELAQQFGQAIGKRGALRSAIGTRSRIPERLRRPCSSRTTAARSSSRPSSTRSSPSTSRAIADLLRIATDGTGVLPEGQLHPDLVNRLAEEAADTAQHVLEMCIRALDYCPPVDITFGDYLRAIVTADYEFDPVDEEHHRVAFVEAFRRWGIVPASVRTLSVDGLLWRPAADAPDENENVVIDIVKRWAADIDSWNLSNDRAELFKLMRGKRAELHNHLDSKLEANSVILSGIDPALPFEVHSIRPSLRIDWNEQARLQWVIELTQRIPQGGNGAAPDYYFRGGCTLLVDAEDGKVRYSIKKPLDDEERKERQRRYLQDEANESLAATYFGDRMSEGVEPFAMLHRF